MFDHNVFNNYARLYLTQNIFYGSLKYIYIHEIEYAIILFMTYC